MRKALFWAPLVCLLSLLLIAATSGNIQWTQLASGSRHGTQSEGQASDGTGTSGNLAKYNADGSLTDSGVTAPSSGTATQTIGSGTIALTTSSISSGSCASASTVTITGTATTDAVIATLNADPTGTTGYLPSTTGSLYIWIYPTSNTVNAAVCNNTGSSITPGAATLNVRVVR